MAIENAAVLALIVILAAAVVALTAALLRRPPAAPPGPDPAMALVQQQLSDLASHVARIGDQIPKEVGVSLGQLAGQVGARLSENAQTLQRSAADTGRLIAEIGQRLGELGQSSQQILELGQDIKGLQQIFQAPKVRGGLGETALGSMLRQIFPADHFTLQHAFGDGETVDAALRLPGGIVPIDSKFPLSGFRAMLEAASDEQRQKARRAFARDVRRHVDDIAGKYIRPAEGTLDFGLMYIPAENVFYEVILQRDAAASDEDISAYALRRRVIPVSPNTLYAYLQAIAYGLMGLKIEQRAREILKSLQQLHADFGLFQDSFQVGQKHLRNAQEKLSEAGDRALRIAAQVEQFVRVAGAVEAPPEVPVPSAPRSLAE
jgi:DNA recombination protein RmuC